METEKTIPAGEKGSEKVHPNTFTNDGISGFNFADSSKNIYQQAQAGSKGDGVNPAFHLFLYLASFFSLGFLISGIINIYFELVNKYVADPALLDQFSSGSQFNDGNIKFGLAALVIASIVYFPIMYLINRKLSKGEIRSDSLVRKFLTYIALFILTAITIGSLAVLFYDYLTGELTGNAFGKILVFFLTALFFVLAYFWEIRRKEFLEKPFRIFYGLAIVIALSGLVTGLVIGDSPTMAREKKIDSSLVSEMQNTKSSIENLYDNNKRLPAAQEIQKSAKFEIKYAVKGDKEYQLCGKFLQVQDQKDFYMKEWNHPAGNYCFTFNIDKRDSKGGVPMPAEIVK